MPRRGRPSCALAAALAAPLHGRLILRSGPPALLERLRGADGSASLGGRTAVLGAPLYGDRRAGALALVELEAGRCGAASVAGGPPGAWAARAWIAALRPGGRSPCRSLAALARLLEALGPRGAAGAVLLRGNLTRGPAAGAAALPEWDPVLDREGAGAAIPLLWVGEEDGGAELFEALSNAATARGVAGGIVGELRWDAPPVPLAPGRHLGSMVHLEIWVNFLDDSARDLVRQLIVAMRPLRRLVQLSLRLPLELHRTAQHVAVGHAADSLLCMRVERFAAFEEVVESGMSSLCMPLPRSYEAPERLRSPDSGLMPFLLEFARQKCMHVWAEPDAEWEYMERWYEHCSGDAMGSERDGETCSTRQLRVAGAIPSQITQCSHEHLGDLVLEEARTPAPGRGALRVRVGGWLYSGPLEAEALAEAACAALAAGLPAPAACAAAWRWRAPRWFVAPVGLWPAAAALAAAGLAPALAAALGGCGRAARVPAQLDAARGELLSTMTAVKLEPCRSGHVC